MESEEPLLLILTPQMIYYVALENDLEIGSRVANEGELESKTMVQRLCQRGNLFGKTVNGGLC